jgi:hypothetical protein
MPFLDGTPSAEASEWVIGFCFAMQSASARRKIRKLIPNKRRRHFALRESRWPW